MNLLVVDDEYYIVHSIVTSLNRAVLGLDEVFSAYSSEQAKRVIETEFVDILITDIEMPHGSGLELIEWVKERGLPILPLILTGHQRFDYAQKAITMQCFSYILKPVMPAELEKELLKAVKTLSDRQPHSQAQAALLETSEPDAADFVTRIRDFIRENIASPDLNRGLLAQELHMNADYLSYLFHTKFGQTLSSYMTGARIDSAKELLLHTNLSLQEISERCGFSSSSYFIKQFKKTAGITPQHYRDAKDASR